MLLFIQTRAQGGLCCSRGHAELTLQSSFSSAWMTAKKQQPQPLFCLSVLKILSFAKIKSQIFTNLSCSGTKRKKNNPPQPIQVFMITLEKGLKHTGGQSNTWHYFISLWHYGQQGYGKINLKEV